ncbi:hypothetical protein BU25DRAFT_451331 [Macroventuria anomochaeta]|uniref:Uncharacterized protein n=1 Tax=Macroventuria anomochaeta TaxID=301207 RepID=A0ACB6RPZ4_9PLEO|nr:uncharacterized protein BU25DRAFT_451331 [Macroventuria anomochaeta]KAF2623337.1 hypothetical protein BU25DRAFT_451331 [Macroventuria anomochaeta]
MQLLSYALLSMATAAYASPLARPTDALKERAVNCNKVNAALGVLKILGSPATTFCSSYLHIPATVTQTATVAPPVATVTISTTTISTIAPAGCSTVVLQDSSAPAPEGKRDVIEKRINLPALSAFAASQLSSGCSCLGLSPKTTSTTTFTPPATSTVKVVATSTACTTCAPNLAPCTFDDPGRCCSQACAAPGVLGNTNDFPACVVF